MHKLDMRQFAGVALDESSIIKHHGSKTLAALMGAFSDTPYRLCCTATPAPNDWAELGTHAEFLGVRSRAEMLAEFFVHDDERHICPLQLEVIRRGVELWTNPGDVVLSPFAGIGSEGHVALQMGRRFVGIELKESYYRQAARNLENALRMTGDLFADFAA